MNVLATAILKNHMETIGLGVWGLRFGLSSITLHLTP